MSTFSGTTVTLRDWLGRNTMRNYPVAESVSVDRGEESDAFLPKELLADADLAAAATEGFAYVGEILYTGSLFVVTLAHTGGGVGWATAPADAPDFYEAEVVSNDGSLTGTIIFGRLAKLLADYEFPVGRRIFEPSEGRLEARCVMETGRPVIESVKVALMRGSVSGDAVVRVGTAVAHEGVKSENYPLWIHVLGLGDYNHRFLADCEPLAEPVECWCPGVVRKISGVTPDNDGNIEVVVEVDEGLAEMFVVGQSVDLAGNTVSLEVGANLDDVCPEDPVLPDKWGRLPVPLHENDCNPDEPFMEGYLDRYNVDGPPEDCPLRKPGFDEPPPEPVLDEDGNPYTDENGNIYLAPVDGTACPENPMDTALNSPDETGYALDSDGGVIHENPDSEE